MSNPIVTVARFRSTLEAEMARNLLENHGITATVTGGNASDLQVGAVGGLSEIYVRESDAEHAAELLKDHFENAQLDDDWLDRAEHDPDVWVCSLCGEAIDNDQEECSFCQTPRDRIQATDGIMPRRPARRRRGLTNDTAISKPGETTSDVPVPADPPELDLEADDLDHGIVVPDIKLRAGDAIASKALTMATIGTCVPFLSWYALFLLLQLSLSHYEFSSQGKGYRNGAWAILAGQFLLLVIVVWARLGAR